MSPFSRLPPILFNFPFIFYCHFLNISVIFTLFLLSFFSFFSLVSAWSLISYFVFSSPPCLSLSWFSHYFHRSHPVIYHHFFISSSPVTHSVFIPPCHRFLLSRFSRLNFPLLELFPSLLSFPLISAFMLKCQKKPQIFKTDPPSAVELSVVRFLSGVESIRDFGRN